MRYRKKRKDDTAARELLRALAAERRRFGHRRLREMAKRQGQCMNLKKVYRLYSEEGLAVRRRRGRKRAIGTRAPLHRAHRPNQIWVLDFVSDVLETRRRFRVFNYGTTLPPLGAFHRQLGLGCHGGLPLWQNTIEYKWLGAGEVLDGCACLRSCRSTGGFGQGACGPDDFKKEGRCSYERNHFAQR